MLGLSVIFDSELVNLPLLCNVQGADYESGDETKS